MSEETVYKAEEGRKLKQEKAWPAYLLIGIGVLLLAARIFNVHLMDFLWPGFILAPGLLLLWPAHNATPERPSRLSFLAVPGSIVTALGLMLFVMNLTGYFEAMAYSWPLLWAAAAWGLQYMYRFDPEKGVHESGHKFIRAMVMFSGGMMVLFELVIWNHFHPLLALGLIAYGIYLLAQKRREMAYK